MDEFGAGGRQLGLLVASFALMQFIAGPIWGRLSDRLGRRPVLLITIAGNTVAMLLLGFADSLEALFAARILSGTFAGNLGVATAYIADATAEKERFSRTWALPIRAPIAGMVGVSVAPQTRTAAPAWRVAC